MNFDEEERDRVDTIHHKEHSQKHISIGPMGNERISVQLDKNQSEIMSRTSVKGGNMATTMSNKDNFAIGSFEDESRGSSHYKKDTVKGINRNNPYQLNSESEVSMESGKAKYLTSDKKNNDMYVNQEHLNLDSDDEDSTKKKQGNLVR